MPYRSVIVVKDMGRLVARLEAVGAGGPACSAEGNGAGSCESSGLVEGGGGENRCAAQAGEDFVNICDLDLGLWGPSQG